MGFHPEAFLALLTLGFFSGLVAAAPMSKPLESNLHFNTKGVTINFYFCDDEAHDIDIPAKPEKPEKPADEKPEENEVKPPAPAKPIDDGADDNLNDNNANAEDTDVTNADEEYYYDYSGSGDYYYYYYSGSGSGYWYDYYNNDNNDGKGDDGIKGDQSEYSYFLVDDSDKGPAGVGGKGPTTANVDDKGKQPAEGQNQPFAFDKPVAAPTDQNPLFSKWFEYSKYSK